MRDIRFRAWDKIENKMSEPFGLPDLTGYSPANERVWSPKIVLQYTGLKDKNGKEIFEGDILNFIKDIAVVEYVHTEFLAISKRNENWCNILSEDSIVIGNIYQNGELLK